MLRVPVVVCLLAAALFAGCVSEGAAKPSPSIAPAAVPVAEADTGSIAGKTLNEEQLPIEGVGVVIPETQNQTKSDASGAFTFNGIPPGTYTILTGRAGYKEASKRIDVLPGEITQVTLVLKGVALPAEWVSVDRQTRTMVAGSYVAAYPNDLQTWNQKWGVKDDPRALGGMHIQAEWNPATALGDGIRFWAGIGAWNSAKPLCVGTGFNPYVCVVPPEKFQVEWPCDYDADDKNCVAEWMFRPGGSRISQGLVGLWPEGSVTVYVSHFFRMPMPADYKPHP